MRLLTSLCLLLFTLGFPSPAPAATRFTPHPSGDRVRAMVCAGGRLWCATDGGVRVYSGTKHERWITTADGLPGAEITDLTVQGPSVLAVTGAGVYTLPMQAGEPVRLACAIRGAREGQTDPQGRLWLVGPFIGLVNAEEWTRTQAERARQPSPSPAGGPRGLLRLAVQGSLVWAAGPTGIGAWDGTNWLSDGDAGMPPSAWISALFVHRDQVYAGTLEGLWRHESGGWRPVGESAGLHDLRAGASFRGALWIAAGADLFSSDDGLTFRRQLPYSGTSCLATLPADPARTPERLYLGTNGQGVARHAGDRWEALDSDGPPSGVMTVTGNGKELWAGSFTGRTAVLLAGRWRDVPAPGPAGEGIAQLVSLNGIVWCRMSNGALWRRVAGTWQRVDRPWASTLCVSGGRLCVGGLGVAWVLENDQWRPLRPTGIKSGAVTGLLQQRGRWWIGTQQGLFRELRPGRWKRYSLGTGLDDPWVTALAEWRGKLWVGTFAGGLSVFERERWKRVPIPGLRQVTSLIAGDRLWAAGTEHVYVQEGTRWRELGASDGLASAGPYTLGWVNGQAIVASTGGVAFERP